ncbi:MAG: molybdopterin-dependent oxidoreductase, partial [Rhodospirillales bacterium]|nr:molybdopterin-dependent oxidoreductase [Rhodospirillales bacterium]
PYRSAGRPEAMFIMERLIDMAARRLGTDRVALRRKNLIGEDAMPYRTALGLTYDSGHLERAMDKALDLGDWDGFAARRDEARTRNRLRGIGLANYIEITSGFPVERSDITVRPEGRVEVVIVTTSSGQGHETSFTQCVAEWLGVPFEAVHMIAGDTDIVKEAGGSHSARSMRMAGIVMGKASDRIIERGKEIAGQMLEVAAADISFADGRFTIAGTDRSVGIFDVAATAEAGPDGPLSGESQEEMQTPGFPYGAQVCEIEVDPETGAVEVMRYAAVDDVGRAINPLILHGQTHGGAVQGAGQALMEHIIHDPESGQLLTGSLMDYALPRADDFPSFAVEIMEVPSPTNPLGVRGGGEGGTTPALAVVINAIVDALSEFGVEHMEMPATPEKIWRAINETNR